ncbi:MAG: DUF1593 domain-containing protein [Planctomycetes bacterium]|nr:DUF1593 domain-containing protein [Planctomycetota bacterium]
MTLEYSEFFHKHRETRVFLRIGWRLETTRWPALQSTTTTMHNTHAVWTSLLTLAGVIALPATAGLAWPRSAAAQEQRARPAGRGTDPAGATQLPRPRLRVVVTTDFPPLNVVKAGHVPPDQKSDPDDLQSLVRFLLYANEFDIEALIATSGTFANKANKQNILDVIERYAEVYQNLQRHDDRYPDPAHLRTVTFQGRHGTWGKPGTANIGASHDSEASDALIAIADKPDPRPVYICVWGDCSVVAQAVWKVRNTRRAAEFSAFLNKLRIHQIATQDGTIGWLRDNFPTLFIIHSQHTYQGMFGGKDPLSDLAWVNQHIRQNHGPLCTLYPHEGVSCTGVCEGDSPSFLWLVSANRGLNDPDDPTQESWGGQFKKDGTKNHYLDGPGPASISKWRAEFQQEFAARANWCLGEK